MNRLTREDWNSMIHLIPLDQPTLEELVRDPDGSLCEMISNGSETQAFLLPLLRQSLDFHRRVGSQAPWQGYLAIEWEGKRLVGICSFKGSPNEAGEVEVAYGTVPGFGGLGYATQMAEALLEIAFRSSTVQRVIAHTLPEPNASTRLLEKIWMDKAGEAIDPEDGEVRRWEIDRPT